MKVKFWKSSNTLAISNVNYRLNLKTYIAKATNNDVVLYDPLGLLEFVTKSFLPNEPSSTEDDYKHMMSIFLYPGCITQVNEKDYVSAEGLKYFFSGLVSSQVFAGKRPNILENKHSKFINWFMKFDFNNIVFKGLKFDTSSTDLLNC